MRRVVAWIVAGAWLGFVAGEEATAGEIASGTLLRSWDDAWLRIFDRSGRPDPDGPMLQRFEPPMDERYQLDLRTAELPIHLEILWARQRNGARLWVQSLSEVDLGNQAEFRLERSTWEDGYVGLRYDRREDWNHSRNLLRFEIGQRAIADTGASAALRIHPRLEKDDIDVEALVGYRAPSWGAARLRIAALDPFINATTALA